MHSAADITSGILGIARGGTGVSDLKTLALSISDLQVVAGTYEGKGAYGSNNKTSLTFTRAPKMLLVQQETCTSSYYGGFVVLQGVKKIKSGGIADDRPTDDMYFVWSGSTVEWYSSSGVDYQYNREGAKYRYIAIL